MEKNVVTIRGPHLKIESARNSSLMVDTVRIESDFVIQADDGFHSFEDLYAHRIALYIQLCKQIQNQPYDDENKFGVWRSKIHGDGKPSYDGWFIMGIGKEKGKQISYHIPLVCWEDTEFAETLDKAPEWDGHTPADVIERLKAL